MSAADEYNAMAAQERAELDATRGNGRRASGNGDGLAEQFNRLPPHSADAEAAVLASMMIEPGCIPIVRDLLTPDAFFSPDNRIIFTAIVALADAGTPIDAVTLVDELERRGALEECGGKTYIAQLLSAVPDAARASHYAAIVREKWTARRGIAIGNNLIAHAHAGDLSADAIRDAVASLDADFKFCGKICPIEAVTLMQNNPNLRDPLIDGILRRTETANLIAASKVGKSHLILDLILAFVTSRAWLGKFRTSGGRVLVLDTELHRETLGHRLAAVASARGILTSEFKGKIDIVSLRGNSRTLPELMPYFRSLGKGTYDLIVIDSLYRLTWDGFNENDNAHVTALYNMLDQIAEITGAGIICVHHSSKGVQGDKSPTAVGSGAGAQSRATDFHGVFREHEEEDCVVFEAACRSWPRPDPLALRWTYPTWNPDDTLDVEAIRKTGSRRNRNVMPPPAKESPKVWTPAEFVAAAVTKESRPKALILAMAEQAGISAKRAPSLLLVAEQNGLIHRHPGADKRELRFSTEIPTVFDVSAVNDESIYIPPPSPHTPRRTQKRRRAGGGVGVDGPVTGGGE